MTDNGLILPLIKSIISGSCLEEMPSNKAKASKSFPVWLLSEATKFYFLHNYALFRPNV